MNFENALPKNLKNLSTLLSGVYRDIWDRSVVGLLDFSKKI